MAAEAECTEFSPLHSDAERTWFLQARNEAANKFLNSCLRRWNAADLRATVTTLSCHSTIHFYPFPAPCGPSLSPLRQADLLDDREPGLADLAARRLERRRMSALPTGASRALDRASRPALVRHGRAARIRFGFAEERFSSARAGPCSGRPVAT